METWVGFDSVNHMFCNICRRYDKTGGEMRLGNSLDACHLGCPIKHLTMRVTCITVVRASTAVTQGPSGKLIKNHMIKLNQEQINEMKKYFSNSFYTAQFNKPFIDFKTMMSTDK